MATAVPSASPTASSSRPLLLTLCAGASVRLLLACTSLPALLVDRNELSTPVTSWKRLQEGHHLLSALGQDPYVAGSFHQSPLLLLLPVGSPALTYVLWTATEVATAYFLSRIADRRKRNLVEGEGEIVWQGWWVAALYLLHPFSIATTLARSTIVFSNLAVAVAVSCALTGSFLSTAFSLSIATHLSLYPALLLPPLTLVLASTSAPKTSRRSSALITTFAFVAHLFTLLGLSHWMTGGSEYLYSVYGVILTIPDLTPTIGLGWYFFIEMFDHFRSFFVGVFQLHILSYLAPLTYAFRSDPLFSVILMLGIVCIFKTYPSLGDFALWHALLATYSELNHYLTRPFLLFCLTLYSLALLPTFHYLWLYSGSGNANFFYASTLVWALSQGGLLLDVFGAYGTREVLRGLGKKGRQEVAAERWHIVQR